MTSPKATVKDTTTTTTTTTTEAPAAKTAAAKSAEPDRYRVLKAFTLDDGLTLMPGEVFEPGSVASWPERRTKQLEDQKYLRPIK